MALILAALGSSSSNFIKKKVAKSLANKEMKI